MSTSHTYEQVCKAMLELRTFTKKDLINYLVTLGKRLDEVQRAVMIVLAKIKKVSPYALGEPTTSTPEGGYRYSVSVEAEAIINQMMSA